MGGRTVLVRVMCLWRVKLLLSVVIAVLFSVAYQWLAHHPVFRPRELRLTVIDRWAGFDVRWVWVYQSLYLLTGTAPLLARSGGEIRTYLRGFAAMCMVSFAVFILWPTVGPRPVVEHPTGMYWLLLTYDGPCNAFPSLHAAMIVYCVGFLRHVTEGRRWWLTAGLVAWSALILWGTLATKEHYLWDLVAGVALGWACDAWAWRGQSEGAAAAQERMLVSSGSASQEGRR